LDKAKLAIQGGPPVLTETPPQWPRESAAVKMSVEAALAGHEWGVYEGSFTTRLRERLAQQFAIQCVQLTCSGTIAVELALRGLGVQPGDEVILAGYDFPGNFRSIEAIGAKPVLVDVTPRGWVIDSQQIETAVSDKTRALIASHLHSQLAPMDSIMRSAERNNFAVVEDACQVPGAVLPGGQAAGSAGHVGVLSFGGSKLLTAGRGGCVLTNDPAIFQRLKIFAERGNDAFPLSQLQAAALLPQLDHLNEDHCERSRRVASVLAGVDNLTLFTDSGPINNQGACYKLPFLLDESLMASFESARETIEYALRAEGVPIAAGFRGFAKRSLRRCRKASQLPHAIAAAERTLILHHPILLEPLETIERLVQAFEKVSAHFSKPVNLPGTP